MAHVSIHLIPHDRTIAWSVNVILLVLRQNSTAYRSHQSVLQRELFVQRLCCV